MTVYVLGAGASRHVGYPFAKTMGTELFAWMKTHVGPGECYAAAAKFFEDEFEVEDFEEFLTQLQALIEEHQSSRSTRPDRVVLAAHNRHYMWQALREWFSDIHLSKAETYKQFASGMVKSGDCIISFNYDDSLDREMKITGKWRIGDGYGFQIDGLEMGSPVKILKLHGSINWIALLFAGRTGPFTFRPGTAFGSRPAIPTASLSFLGYSGAIDHIFPGEATAQPAMILPTRSKQFLFSTNLGPEFAEFWDELWRQAEGALCNAGRVVICGYSLLPVDERACELLLNTPCKDA